MKWGQTQRGFTIVELLIVVVVIAILASITIVSYNGITQRATNSAIMAEVSQATDKLEVYRLTENTSSYPSTSTAAGINARSGTLGYFPDASGASYCVQIQKGTASYFATGEATTPTAGACSTSGLIAQWRLNGDTTDSSTNTNNGTPIAAFTPAAGQNGVNPGAMTISSSNYINVPHSDALASDPQTFSFWIRPSNWSTATGSTILAKRAVSNTAGYFIAYLNSGNALYFDCGGSAQRWNTGYAPPLNTWTHIVLTCPTGGNLALYVNGAQQASGPPSNRTTIGNTAGTVLRIGADSSASPTLIMNGALDDIRLYNRALSDADISSLYSGNAQ